jgi:uncharacterized protein
MATMILKITEQCNSNCAYCDVVTNKPRAGHMPLALLETVFQRLNEFLEADPRTEMNVIWHGGEPLLVGPDYFRAAHAFQQKHCRGTQGRIRHSIQSNLTLFSDAFAEPFRALGIDQIGTSFDPEPGVRGPGKPSNTDLYNRNFMRGDVTARRHGLGAGIIYVVTKRSLERPLEVFYYLTNLRLDGGFNMNPVLLYDSRRDDLAITPHEYVEFLGALFPVWWKHQARYPNVDPFYSLTSIIRDRELRLGCSDSGRCAYGHVNVDPAGETSQCGRSSDWGLLSYGNIRDRSLADILRDTQRDVLMERNNILRNGECGGCRFWSICHGGCPLDSWPKHGDLLHRSEWGCSRKAFVERYYEPITGLRFVPHE